MNQTIEKQTLIWNMKFFAVVGIVACHCLDISKNATWISEASVGILDYFIGYGVSIFYFLSGYLFHPENKFINFIYKKSKSLIVPWIVTGTIVFLYIVIRKGGFSLIAWGNWILGIDTYLYFMADLLVYFLLLYWIKKSKLAMRIFGVVLIYALLENPVLGITTVSKLFDILQINAFYLLLFYFGAFLDTCKLNIQKSIIFCKKTVLITLFIFVGVTYLQKNKAIYDSVLWLIEWVKIVNLLIFVTGFAAYLNEKWKWATEVGKYSFSIYLLHMPFAGMIAYLLNLNKLFSILTIVRPFIVIALTMLLIRFILFLDDKFQLHGKFNLIIGAR